MKPLIVSLLWAASVSAVAAGYPDKPIRFLVGFAPGGANDLVARVAAAKLSPRLGQQVVVDNRAGAGGNIAHDIVAKAAPDGYTMVLASVASLAMSPGLLGKVPYDPVNDFSPVAQLVDVSSLLTVHAGSALKTVCGSSSKFSINAGSQATKKFENSSEPISMYFFTI